MAVSSVASSTTSATLAATNTARKGIIIANDDANALYVLLGSGTASATNYTFRLLNGEYEGVSGYTGQVCGVWAADGSGSARVTEF